MQTPDYEHMIHCPCCGAPITGNTCEYCGCVIYDFADIDLTGRPSYIRLKTEIGIFTGKVLSNNESQIELYVDSCDYVDTAGNVVSEIVKQKTCRITLSLDCIADSGTLFTVVPLERPYKKPLDDWG